ncbi:MAG: CRISPR-associated endonuclease Cas3'', partial [Kiritimatiellae bacterium]|nr:CRISPR-associated endonuclease Cas3'' [Kiritimatiellia bacterium]
MKIIPKILNIEYVKKHIKSKCEYYMKMYGYNPLDSPPKQCDNSPRLKGRLFPMLYAHSRFSSSTSAWQTLQAHCKGVAELSASCTIRQESDTSLVSSLSADRACTSQCDVALAREGQSLLSHLEGVAALAQRYAYPVGLGYIAYVCGLLHDLGKYSRSFKKYLKTALSGQAVQKGEVHHAWEGALVILRQLGQDRATIGLADILANVVASHHGGLTDMISDSERVMPSR